MNKYKYQSDKDINIMDDLITYLLNYAFDHGYGYEILNGAENNWPSLAYPDLNLIF